MSPGRFKSLAKALILFPFLSVKCPRKPFRRRFRVYHHGTTVAGLSFRFFRGERCGGGVVVSIALNASTRRPVIKTELPYQVKRQNTNSFCSASTTVSRSFSRVQSSRSLSRAYEAYTNRHINRTTHS